MITSLLKGSASHKREILTHSLTNLRPQKRELYATIASLEKDIASLKREIRERDETIGDKERRIYDLKKKNQVSLMCSFVTFAILHCVYVYVCVCAAQA